MTDGQELPESEVERTLGTLATLDPVYAEDAAAAAKVPVTIDDLYRTHRMQMVRLAILLVDDLASAEDVVQEAFAGLYRNWSGAAGSGGRDRIPADGRGERVALDAAPASDSAGVRAAGSRDGAVGGVVRDAVDGAPGGRPGAR